MQNSVKILFVITLVFLKLVSSDDTEQDVKDLVARYEILMSSDSGYVKPDALQKMEELRNLSAQTLKDKIVSELTNIQCGYVYSSLHLLTLFKMLWDKRSFLFLIGRMFIEKKNEKTNGAEFGILTSESMIKEAIRLLSSVYNLETRSALNIMWLFYCYAENLYNYHFGYHENRTEFNIKELTLVYNELNQFTTNYCREHNVYNNKFTNGIYYNDLVRINDSINPTGEIIEIMQQRKAEIHVRIVKCIYDTNYFNKTIQKFPMYRLRLNKALENENFMKTLLEDFAKIENWKDIKDKLALDYYNSIYKHQLVDRLLSLAEYQRNFIKLIQILTLQVTLSRLIRIRKYLFNLILSTRPAIKKCKTTLRKFYAYLNMKRLVKDLTYFYNYFCLHDDIWFKTYVQEIRNIKNITIENLNEIINSTATTLNSFYAMFFNCTSTYNAEDDNFLGSTLLSVYIRSVMHGIDFQVIKSFIDFTNYLENFREHNSINENEIELTN